MPALSQLLLVAVGTARNKARQPTALSKQQRHFITFGAGPGRKRVPKPQMSTDQQPDLGQVWSLSGAQSTPLSEVFLSVLSFCLPLISLPCSQSPVFPVETSLLLEMRSWRGEEKAPSWEGGGRGIWDRQQSSLACCWELNCVTFDHELSSCIDT